MLANMDLDNVLQSCSSYLMWYVSARLRGFPLKPRSPACAGFFIIICFIPHLFFTFPVGTLSIIKADEPCWQVNYQQIYTQKIN